MQIEDQVTTPTTSPRNETQRERWGRHYRRTIAIRDEKHFFKQFFINLKIFFTDTWFDFICIAAVGAVTGTVWGAPGRFDRLFPVTMFTSGDVIYPEFAYPYDKPIFSPAGAGLVAGLIPVGVILFTQIWERSFFNAANAIFGLTMSMATSTAFQVVLKKSIGGLRPHFLAVCKPVIPENYKEIGVGYQNMMFTVDQVCTGNREKIGNAIESFPSGHANIAFAGLLYLSIYLFAHLRVQNLSRRAGYWKMPFVLAPILTATYLTSTLVLGYHHHGYDVIFGALIGITMALFSYRMVFCSVHDPKWNTVPRRRFEREERERLIAAAKDEEGSVDSSRLSVVDGDRGSSDPKVATAPEITTGKMA